MTLSLVSLMAPVDNPSAGLSMILLQIVAFGAVIYFLILRPQQTARKKHEELLKGLKKNDEVVTVGGIIGKVKEVKEDRVTIESGSSTLVVERTRIVKVGETAAAGVPG